MSGWEGTISVGYTSVVLTISQTSTNRCWIGGLVGRQKKPHQAFTSYLPLYGPLCAPVIWRAHESMLHACCGTVSYTVYMSNQSIKPDPSTACYVSSRVCCLIVYITRRVYIFSHHVAAKSRITCNEISSPNSLLLNLNSTKHSFWRTSSLFHFPQKVNNTISFDYKPCTHAL